MSDGPLVSVIVPVWNGETQIGACLDALDRQTCPAERFEIIVIDNGSTDGTAAIVRDHPRALLLSEPAPGSYRARNLGLANARGEYALFTDADCVPDAGWVAAALEAVAAHPGAGVAGGRITLFPVGEPQPGCATLEELFSFNQQRNLADGYFVTANFMSRTALLRDLGGFDAELKSGGDVDMSRRIAAAGHSLVYAPAMKVGHPIRGTFDELRSKRLRVLGGAWPRLARTRLGGLRLAYNHTKSTLIMTGGVVAASGIAFGRKCAAIAVLGRLYLAGLAEIARLARGGEPRRS